MVYGWIGVPFDEEETHLAVQLMRKFNIVLRDELLRVCQDRLELDRAHHGQKP